MASTSSSACVNESENTKRVKKVKHLNQSTAPSSSYPIRCAEGLKIWQRDMMSATARVAWDGDLQRATVSIVYCSVLFDTRCSRLTALSNRSCVSC